MNTKVDEGKLISGKEALIALANGEDVECSITGSNEWHNKTVNITPYYFIGNGVGQFEFRLKPRTITSMGLKCLNHKKIVLKRVTMYLLWISQTTLVGSHRGNVKIQ